LALLSFLSPFISAIQVTSFQQDQLLSGRWALCFELL